MVLANTPVPGIYILESTYGATPEPLSRHDSVYLFVTSSLATDASPRYITSVAEFTNVFGVSPSTPYVAAYFQQVPEVGIWVVPVISRPSYPVTLPAVTAGTTYGITINGIVYQHVALGGQSPFDVLDVLIGKVNSSPDAYMTRNKVVVPPGTISGNNITIGSVVPTGTVTTDDWVSTIYKTFVKDEELIPGFILAPEFYSGASAGDHSYVANVADLAAQVLGGVSLVDPRTVTASSTNISLAIAERNALVSPKGHSAYYFPSLRNSAGQVIPPSVYVAAIATKAQRNSYATPPAGQEYPLYAVSGVTVKVDTSMQKMLNPIGVNCIRWFNSKGYLIYGARSLSTNAFYTFITTRIILNVVARSLQLAMEAMVLTGMSYGLSFSAAKSNAVSICELMRLDGSLWGSTPDEAYKVVCDLTNNNLANLDNGQLYLDVIVKPTPVTEAIIIKLSRASLSADLGSTTPNTATTATEVEIKPQK